MTSKPSDSINERARELLSCTHGDPCAYDHTCKNHRVLADALADAFNLGAGVAYEDAVRVCWQPKKFTGNPSTTRVCAWEECAEAIRQRTPADALAAVERIRKEQFASGRLSQRQIIECGHVVAELDETVCRACKQEQRKVSEPRLAEAEWWMGLVEKENLHPTDMSDAHERIAQLQAEAAEKERQQ